MCQNFEMGMFPKIIFGCLFFSDTACQGNQCDCIPCRCLKYFRTLDLRMSVHDMFQNDFSFKSNDSLDTQITASIDRGDFHLAIFSLLSLIAWSIYMLFYNSRLIGLVVSVILRRFLKSGYIRFGTMRFHYLWYPRFHLAVDIKRKTNDKGFCLHDKRLYHPLLLRDLCFQLLDKVYSGNKK